MTVFKVPSPNDVEASTRMALQALRKKSDATYLPASGGTVSGATTVTGSFTASGGVASPLTLLRQDTTDEGGQVGFEGAGTNPAWYIDVYQASMRWWNATGGVVASLSSAGTFTFATAAVTTVNATTVNATTVAATSSVSAPSISSSGTLTVNSSTVDHIKSLGAGAGYYFESRSGAASGYSVWYRSATTTYLYNSTTGTNLLSIDNSGYLRPSSAIRLQGTNALNFETYGGDIWMQDTTWIRFNKSFYNGANTIANDGHLSIGYSGTTDGTYRARVNGNFLANYIYSNGGITARGQLSTQRNGGTGGGNPTTSNWNDASLLIEAHYTNGGATTASLSFHPGAVAPQFRVGYGDGTIYVRDSGGSGASGMSGAFWSTSSQRYKQDINEWPARSLSSAVPSAVDTVRRLRPVSYRMSDDALKDVPVTKRRADALSRLNKYLEGKGLPEYKLMHECSTETCGHTADSPCPRVVNHNRGEMGFIAEEIEEVLPEAVLLNSDFAPEALRVDAIVAVTVAALKELVDRVELLEVNGGR